MATEHPDMTDQVIQYATGLWGEEAASEVDNDVKDRILSRPRAKEFATWRPPEPSLEEVRNKLGGPNLGDDELLMRYVLVPHARQLVDVFLDDGSHFLHLIS
jgi:oxaloacetate decarboxylase (Na+ extruding) subunit alpha